MNETMFDPKDISDDMRQYFEEVEVTCGAPWRRVMERTAEPDYTAKGSRFDTGKTFARDGGERTQQGERTLKQTAGWLPTCACYGASIPTWEATPEGPPAEPEDARPAWTCPTCEGSGVEINRPLLAEAEGDTVPCSACHGKASRRGDREWEAWLAAYNEWQAAATAVEERNAAALQVVVGLGLPVEPATCLDPFSGSGTTALVAVRLGRRAIGIDLNADYVKMAEGRLAKEPRPLPGIEV